MELGIQRGKVGNTLILWSTEVSAGPLFLAGMLLHGPAGEQGGEKHSMCFSSTVTSSFDPKKKGEKSADDSTTRLFF